MHTNLDITLTDYDTLSDHDIDTIRNNLVHCIQQLISCVPLKIGATRCNDHNNYNICNVTIKRYITQTSFIATTIPSHPIHTHLTDYLRYINNHINPILANSEYEYNHTNDKFDDHILHTLRETTVITKLTLLLKNICVLPYKFINTDYSCNIASITTCNTIDEYVDNLLAISNSVIVLPMVSKTVTFNYWHNNSYRC